MGEQHDEGVRGVRSAVGVVLAALGAAAGRVPAPPAPVERLGFWVAVAMPLGYLPVLADGVGSRDLALLFALFALHALALSVGHGYDRR